ncbi:MULTISPECIES: flavodoxin family protein [Lactobacillaceae]|uniref:flavodoxin family protein n=1 Tax=Lactobacillaceae TaxID=33958 RepID=UPI001456770D|nr:flavodoxin family protein [Lactobacillus sp. HBUAS51381]NLR09850.1 flavodoxin family protein [Lactobacillus sp. HBUAS51381]
MTILFINGSSRRHGNTATLGERLLANYPHVTRHLTAYQLHFVQDYRDTPHAQCDPHDDYEALMHHDFANASDIVLGTPVYWYTMSGQLKVFMDRWFDSFRQDFPFAGKRVYLLIVGADHPEHKATGIVDAVRYSCDWLQMDFQGASIVTADGPHDVATLPTLPTSCRALQHQLSQFNA